MQVLYVAPPLPPGPPTIVRRRKSRPPRPTKETERMVLGFATDWVTLRQVMEMSGLTLSGARKLMMKLAGLGSVRSRFEPGGNTLQYRVAAPGEICPLFESPFDARPLADCFGGFTFLKGNVPWHQ